LANLLFEETRVLEIFTTNYDSTVEYYIQSSRVKLVDGFENNRFQSTWKPASFDSPTLEGERVIKLYKLHGSVSWYSDEQRNLLWLDVADAKATSSGVKVENLVIYPLDEKSILQEPFIELFSRFRILCTRRSEVILISIGYSFRDEHILSLVGQMLVEKRGRIIIIDPEAKRIAALFQAYKPLNRIRIIEKCFEDTTLFEELKKALNDPIPAFVLSKKPRD
jgi:hypothetical protein